MLDLDRAVTAELTVFISTGKQSLLGPALMSAPAIHNLPIPSNRRGKKSKNGKCRDKVKTKV